LKKAEIITALIFLALGVYFITTSYTTYQYLLDNKPGPGFLPRYIGWGMVTSAALYLMSTLRQTSFPKNWFPTDRAAHLRILTIISGGLAMTLLLDILGTFLSVALFMGILTWYLGNRSILAIIGVAIGTSLVVQFIFIKWLMIPLPSGILGF